MEQVVNASYFAERGFRVFKCNKDKSPSVSSWLTYDYTKDNSCPISEWECYGVSIPKGFMVIDCDLYKSETAFKSCKDVLDLAGPSMFCVDTGSSGKHLWYRLPFKDTKYRKQIPEFPGVDFLTFGAYVIGPGSVSEKGYYIYRSGDLPYLQPNPTEELEI